MARSFSDLTARKLIREHRDACEAGERRGTTKFSWGQGLVLAVGPTGGASWIARVQAPNGKRRDIGLGKFGDVSVEEARRSVAKHKEIARAGRDPKAVKDAERFAERNPVPTFEEAARAVHEERGPHFRNPKHRDQWLNTLRDYVFPKIGSLLVNEVDVGAVTRALKPIWRSKPETARRVLQRIAAVSAWAVAHGYRDHELAVNALRMGLGDQPKKPQHFAAVPVEDAPAVFQKLAALDALGARCLVFCILTAARSGEARGARWAEVDYDAATWTIPAERTKTNQDHVVPLCPEAIALLQALPIVLNEAGKADLIFPSTKHKPLSDVALTKILQLRAPGATVHGWRSTFRDWTAEQTDTPSEVAEAALAHVVTSKVEAAYRRTKFLEKRRPLMAAWANFLTSTGAEITSLDDARRAKRSTG